MQPYDWYNEIGYKDQSALKPGRRVLYEDPLDLDEDTGEWLASIKLPVRPYEVSPRGFVKISKSDIYWHDPRERTRRIHENVSSTRSSQKTTRSAFTKVRSESVSPLS